MQVAVFLLPCFLEMGVNSEQPSQEDWASLCGLCATRGEVSFSVLGECRNSKLFTLISWFPTVLELEGFDFFPFFLPFLSLPSFLL
jgi:hypothetical protein